MAGRMVISERDLQTMLGIVAAADDGGDGNDPLPWPVLTGLQDLLRCDAVSLTMYDTDTREYLIDQGVGDLGLPDGEWQELDEVFWAHYWDSPPCHYPDSSGDLVSVTVTSDFYSARQWHSAPMYCEWFRPMGVEHEMMLCLPSQFHRVRRLLFFREPGADFTPRERGILKLLRPHLDDVYRAQRRRQHTTPQLTARQRQLLGLVAAGYTNGQIARRLFVSDATVRKHLEHIFERLQVTSRTAAVTRAFGPEP